MNIQRLQKSRERKIKVAFAAMQRAAILTARAEKMRAEWGEAWDTHDDINRAQIQAKYARKWAHKTRSRMRAGR